MPRYIYGIRPEKQERELLDTIPDNYNTIITDKMIKNIWSTYRDIEIKTEKEPENETAPL